MRILVQNAFTKNVLVKEVSCLVNYVTETLIGDFSVCRTEADLSVTTQKMSVGFKKIFEEFGFRLVNLLMKNWF